MESILGIDALVSINVYKYGLWSQLDFPAIPVSISAVSLKRLSSYILLNFKFTKWVVSSLAHSSNLFQVNMFMYRGSNRPLLLSPVYTVHILTPSCRWSAALNKHNQFQLYTSFFYYEDCIILLHCQFIRNISDNSILTRQGSVITQGVRAGGGGMVATSDTTSRRTAELWIISTEAPCWETERK